MPISRLIRLFILLSLSCLLSISGASAQSYTTKDAQYVTNSRNDAVLRYIVCLEIVAGTLPSSMSIPDRINRGEAKCKSAAARLPKTSREPDALSIRSMILECGFRPGEGSPGFDCGDAISIGNGRLKQQSTQPSVPQPKLEGLSVRGPIAQPLVADEVYLDPRRIELGKWLEGFAIDGNNLWATESGQRTLAKVNFKNGAVQKRYKVGRLPVDTVIIGESTFTLVATDKLLLKHSKSGQKSQLAKLKDCPETMTASGTNIFVLGLPTCSSDSSRVTRVDTQNGNKKSSPNLGELANAMTATASEIWVGHARDTAISIVNKARLTVEKLDLSGVEVWALASNSQKVFAGGRYADIDNDGTIIMVDAHSREENSRYSVPGMVTQITANEDYVVAVGLEGTIWVLSARDLSLIRTIHSSTGKYDPRMVTMVGNDLVISASTYRGDNGAILVFSNFLPKGLSNTKMPSNRPVVQGARPNLRQTAPPNTKRPGKPSRPGVRSQTGFPVAAGSNGGRVRSKPNLNGKQLASTRKGDEITLLKRTNSMYKGYPWFQIRMASNGQTGYQWGGVICSYGTNLAGTTGFCDGPKATNKNRAGNIGKSRTTPSRPVRSSGNNGNAGNNGHATGSDVFLGILKLAGKIIENGNKSDNNIFQQNLNVNANTGLVSAARNLAKDQLAIYTIQGTKGQRLFVETWSQTLNSAFAIYINNAVEGGATLPGAGAGDYPNNFDGKLPITGQYQIVVGASNEEPVYFEMSVSLEDGDVGYQATNSAAISNSRLLVGTYSSETATSGNIEYDEAAQALTWTEFCGPTINLQADWSNSQLYPFESNMREFVLEVRKGKIKGFKTGQTNYRKEEAIVMPGCTTARPTNAFWKDNPLDTRVNKNYSSVPNAHWATCEADNYDRNSPNYNNETAYWDCADAGMQPVSNDGSDQQNNSVDWTQNPKDTRFNDRQYDQLTDNYVTNCGAANNDRNSPSFNNETAYWDCLDDAMQIFYGQNTQQTPVQVAPVSDPRANNDYSILSMGYLSSCAQDHGEGSSPYYDCLDSSVITENANQRVEAEYPDLSADEVEGCSTYGYGSDDFFICLQSVSENKSGGVAADNQAGNSQQLMQQLVEYCYQTYSEEDASQCEIVLAQCVNAYPDSSSNEFDQCVEASGW
ncbi:MAG: hypothetical protein AB8B94_16680 [Hyphomicrobiales bacterium]